MDARAPHPGGQCADARRWSLLAIFYLDSYRNRLEKERVHKVAAEASMAATALQVGAARRQREALLADLSQPE